MTRLPLAVPFQNQIVTPDWVDCQVLFVAAELVARWTIWSVQMPAVGILVHLLKRAVFLFDHLRTVSIVGDSERGTPRLSAFIGRFR